MLNRLVFLTALTLVLAKAEAQVTYVEHGPFTQMLERMEEINRDDSRRLKGYRIQIVSTTDRLKLEEVQRRFDSTYPEYGSDWVHEAPYYKLRTGAFVDRAKATTYLYRLKREFPSAYPAMVRDIRPSEVVRFR